MAFQQKLAYQGTLPNLFVSKFPLHTQPSKRISLACIQCRSRHLRCDAATPTCSRCRDSGKQCTYQKSRRGGRRPRKATQSNSISSSYGSHGIRLVPAAAQALAQIHDNWDCPDWNAASPVDGTSLLGCVQTYALRLDQILGSSDSAQSSERLAFNALGFQVSEDLLDSYYKFFHPAHPCVPPRKFLEHYLVADPFGLKPVLLAMQFIGSLYIESVPSAPHEALVLDTLAERETVVLEFAGYYVQALVLYSIASYWCDKLESSLDLLDQAISKAMDVGLHTQSFASRHGWGDSVRQESWRRTWWAIYLTDILISAGTHTFPSKTSKIVFSVDLPCEEEAYESGVSLYPI